jgi:acetyl esterase/lipase
MKLFARLRLWLKWVVKPQQLESEMETEVRFHIESYAAELVAEISTHFDHRLYAPVDAPDRESCRPDFAVAIYPGHLWTEDNLELNPRIRITRQTPPTFLLQAENDPIDPVQNSLAYWAALKQAGVPVEMHLYAEGGHAFGLRRTEFSITEWPKLVERWLLTIGITPK